MASEPRQPSLLSIRGLPTILGIGAAVFGGWAMLLPVVPLALSLSGESDAIAGASTAVFMAATVAVQLATPKLLRAWGYRRVLAAGAALLGLPAFALLLSTDAIPVLGISAVRGIGFGLITVAGAAFVAEITPDHQIGRASAAIGIASAGGQVVGLPAGLALVDLTSTAPVFVIGALIPTVAMAAVALLPDVYPKSSGDGERRVRLPLTALLGPLLAMIVLAAALGGVTSLVPIATHDVAIVATIALAATSAFQVAGRYAAGALSDRFGPGRLLVPSLAVAATGLALLAFALHSDVWALGVIVGGALLGLGFGACQNDSLVVIFAAAGPYRRGSASAAWNIAYDGGTGIGALSLGVLATVQGYSLAFVVAAVAVALAVPFTLVA
ncbi:MFS transporter [Antrihabitans spumae]|uniref:MFS transporter n=1 Tax=Antrihabitans spumae TaxID=3373370 RepID=A0ABW7K1S4_9NOCA